MDCKNSNNYNVLCYIDGGDGGIRTPDRASQPYNGLANRRLQPLGHVSVHAERRILDAVPDVRADMPEPRRDSKTT
jgi:hypothetical protein